MVRLFQDQHLAFKIACVYLIFEYNRPQQIWPALAVVPWAQLLIIAGLLFSLFDQRSRQMPARTSLVLVAFALAFALSSATAYSPDQAWSEWVLWVSWIVVVVFLTRTVSTRERFIVFVCVYYLVNLKMAQHGFRSWAMRGFSMTHWGVTGSPGWFQNSGEFGMQMAMLVPLLITHLALLRDRFSRVMLLFGMLFLGMVVGSVVASNSRGALLGLVACGFWILMAARHRLKALFALAIAAIAVVSVIPEETMKRFSTAGEDTTSQSRLTYWQYGLETVREQPVLGVGFRNWVPYLAQRHPEAFQLTGRVEVIHNTPLEVASELGLLGFFVFAATIVYIFRLNAKTAIQADRTGDRWVHATAKGLNGGLIVYLVTSFFMSVFMYPFFWVLLAMSVSCAAACHAPYNALPSHYGRAGSTRKVAHKHRPR
jgi:O-antigen ligase